MKNGLKKIKIAITGGIGSGKSQAAKFIKELGFAVFSCDEIYKDIILSSKYITQVKKRIPECVIDNQIDKKILAKIVFADTKRRKDLNNIAHPMIMDELLSAMKNAPTKLVFAEVPLLFEGQYENLFDFVIVIQRDITQRIESVKIRDGMSEEEIVSRMQSQFDYSKIKDLKFFENKKFIVIDNNGALTELEKKLISIVNRLNLLT